MRILLLLLLPLIASAQLALQRTPLTTNRAPVTYSNGETPIWNAAMGAWSNGVSSAALSNPNIVWVATNGTAAGDGSYNSPKSLSNGVTYARTTFGNNFTVAIRSGRYDVNGFVTLLDETNKHPINLHGGTNIAIIGEGYPLIYSTNFCILSVWGVDGLLIRGIAFEGKKQNASINALDAAIQLRGGTRNVVIDDCRLTRIPNHGIGAFNSTLGATNVIISSLMFEDVGATSGVVGLTIDGACIVPNGSRWTTINCIMDRVVRGWEPYSGTNLENLSFIGNTVTRFWLEGVTMIPENGWISNVVVSGNMFINPQDIGQTRVAIRASSARQVHISDNIIEGAMQAGVSMDAGAPDGFHDWFVSGNTFQNNPLNGYGVYMEHDGTRASTNISFVDNKFLNLFGPAMSLRGPGLIVKGNEFINVAIEGAGSAAVRVSNEAGTTRDGVIMGNLFKPSVAADGGVQLGAGVTNWVVAGNFFDGWAQHPITDANAPGINPKPINSTTNGVFTGTNIARFGINTNNPQASLHVVPSVAGQNYVRVDDTNGASRFQVGVKASGLPALWLPFGYTPNLTNYSFAAGADTLLINAPANTGVNAIYFSLGESSKWFIGPTSLSPVSGNIADLGSVSQPVSTIYATNSRAELFTSTGPGPGILSLTGTNGAISSIEAGSPIATNNTLRLPIDAQSGPMISTNVAGGTNQIGVVTGGTSGQAFFRTSVGYAWSNVVSGGTFPLSGDANAAGFTISNGVFLASLGAAATPSFSFFGDADTGWYRSASDTISLAAGGALQMSFSTAGMVIYQNDALGFSLTTGAADMWIDRTAPGVLDFYNGAVAWATNRIYGASVTDLISMGHDGGHNWAFLRSSTNRLVLGVGTNSSIFINADNQAMGNFKTNTASADIVVTDFVINTTYTNDNRRAFVVFTAELDANATGVAKAALLVDQAVDGAYETIISAQATGLSDAVQHVICGWLQPNARFAITNISSGAGSPTAAVVAGSSQWVKQ